MTDKKKANEKPIRVQFQKGVDAKDILPAIKKLQDEWAKKFPERAHQLYPNVFTETGERIQTIFENVEHRQK
jgi:hypothetical protein